MVVWVLLRTFYMVFYQDVNLYCQCFGDLRCSPSYSFVVQLHYLWTALRIRLDKVTHCLWSTVPLPQFLCIFVIYVGNISLFWKYCLFFAHYVSSYLSPVSFFYWKIEKLTETIRSSYLVRLVIDLRLWKSSRSTPTAAFIIFLSVLLRIWNFGVFRINKLSYWNLCIFIIYYVRISDMMV